MVGISMELHHTYFSMIFNAKRTLDCIPRGEGVANCLMKHITLAGYKVFKVSSICLFVPLIVIVHCSHKYNPTILVTAIYGIFAVTSTLAPLIVVVCCGCKYNLTILATLGIFAVTSTLAPLIVVIHCSRKYNLMIQLQCTTTFLF